MISRQLLYLATAVLCTASGAGAQTVSGSNATDVSITRDTTLAPPHTAVSSTIDRPSDAVRRAAMTPAAPLPQQTQSLGTAKAQMAVGGAAIVVGALIGGDGGNVLMFGGAIIGLYGLWNYLK